MAGNFVTRFAKDTMFFLAEKLKIIVGTIIARIADRELATNIFVTIAIMTMTLMSRQNFFDIAYKQNGITKKCAAAQKFRILIRPLCPVDVKWSYQK
jgi:hypothetical protein